MINEYTIHALLLGVEETNVLAHHVDNNGCVPGIRVLIITAQAITN